MYQTNIFHIRQEDREFPPVPIFIDLPWNGRSVDLCARKINENEIWIEIRPLLPPSVEVKEGQTITGRFALITGNGFNEFSGVVEKLECCALTPSYNVLSLLIIRLNKISSKALAEVEAYKDRFVGKTFYEKTDPFAAVG